MVAIDLVKLCGVGSSRGAGGSSEEVRGAFDGSEQRDDLGDLADSHGAGNGVARAGDAQSASFFFELAAATCEKAEAGAVEVGGFGQLEDDPQGAVLERFVDLNGEFPRVVPGGDFALKLEDGDIRLNEALLDAHQWNSPRGAEIVGAGDGCQAGAA
jgi:hypothetical protein